MSATTTTIMLLCVVSLPLGCKKRPVERVRFGKAALIAQLDLQPSAAVRGRDGSFVVGTTDGRLLLLEADGKRRWITPELSPGGAEKAVNGENAPASAPTARYGGPITAVAISDDGKRVLASGGRRIAWWQIRPRVELLAELVGPQRITAAILSPGNKTALFGTSQGHLLEWTLDRQEAKPLKHGCSALPADRKRDKLPPSKRCPYGTHIELSTGKGICTYPLTHLIRQGDVIARACRTGVVALFRHGQPPHRHQQAGDLSALTFVGSDRMLFARTDGELRLYDIASRQTPASFSQDKPRLVAESNGLLAIASATEVRLRKREGATVGAVKLPAPPIWLALRKNVLQVLLADGRLLRWSLEKG